MRNVSLILACLVTSSTLLGLDYSPWLGNIYEFEGNFSLEADQSQKVNTLRGNKKKHLHAEFAKATLGFTFDPEWSGEVELQGVKATHLSATIDSARIFLRRSFLNDIAGDPFSLTAGISLGLVNRKILHNLSLFNHGQIDGEAQFAVGKEFGYFGNREEQKSYFHAWAGAFIGTARKSAAWIRGEAHLETILKETHFFDLFLHDEKGLGSKKLHSIHNFQGYSHIAYEALDLGISYRYKAVGYGSLFGQVKRRLYGKFCPRDTAFFELGIIVPFSF